MENKPFVIVTDTTSDITAELAKKLGVGLMGISYNMEGEEYDGLDHVLTPEVFYQKMREGAMPQTQQINPDQFYRYFKVRAASGLDIIYLAFASELSGTYNNALTAKEDLLQEYPDIRIEVFDTKSASIGEGLQVYLAAQMQQRGASYDEIVASLEDTRNHLTTYFTPDDLFHLHRGGRVSKATAIVGSMLGIKPVLHVSDEGKLLPVGKVRGRKAALAAMVDALVELGQENPADDIVMVGHGGCKEDAEAVVRMVKERTGRKHVMLFDIGPCIGAHSGPGTIDIAFLGTKR